MFTNAKLETTLSEIITKTNYKMIIIEKYFPPYIYSYWSPDLCFSSSVSFTSLFLLRKAPDCSVLRSSTTFSLLSKSEWLLSEIKCLHHNYVINKFKQPNNKMYETLSFQFVSKLCTVTYPQPWRILYVTGCGLMPCFRH